MTYLNEICILLFAARPVYIMYGLFHQQTYTGIGTRSFSDIFKQLIKFVKNEKTYVKNEIKVHLKFMKPDFFFFLNLSDCGKS